MAAGSAPTFQAKFISVLAGLLGVATGIAVFILMVHKPEEISLWFGLFLLVAATLSFAFEYIRSEIEGHEEKLSFSRILTVLVVLAIFELFVTAIHASFSLEWEGLQEIATAIAGPALSARVQPEVNLVLLALLWVVIGGVLALAMAYAIYWPFQLRGRLRWLESAKRRGPAMGLLAGTVAAPALVLGYILAVRIVLEFIFMLTRPEEWANYLDKLAQYSPAPWLIWAMSWTSSRWGSWGVLAGLAFAAVALIAVRNRTNDNSLFKVIVLALVAVFALPLAGASVVDDLKNVGMILGFVAVLWSVTGLLLGAMVPVLDRWSANPRNWAYLSWVAAGIMLIFAVAVRAQWFWACAILAVVFVVAGALLRLGGSPADYWTIAVISIGVLILGVTHLMFQANFFNVSELCLSVIGGPAPVLETWGQRPATLRFSDLSDDQMWYIKTHDPELTGEIERYVETEKRREARNMVAAVPPAPPAELSDLLALGAHALTSNQSLSESLRERSRLLNELMREEDAIGRMAKAARFAPRSAPKSEISTAGLLAQSKNALAELEVVRAAVKKESERPVRLSLKSSYADIDRVIHFTTGKPDALTTLSAGLAAQGEAVAKETTVLAETAERLTQKAAADRRVMAQKFELCIAGSAGFWLAMGILATWSIRKRAVTAPEHNREPMSI